MKFKLKELKTNPEKCKVKLSLEIESNYKYKSLQDEKIIKQTCENKASEIIDSFLTDTFKSNKVTNFEAVTFGITFCEKNDFDTVWLEYNNGTAYWRAENSLQTV